MKKIVLCTLLFAIGLSCKKSRDEAPAPAPMLIPTTTTGIVTGKISPASAVTAISAFKLGILYPAILDTTTGIFIVQGLAAGTYSIGFAPAPSFCRPPETSLQVTAGQTTDLGTITVPKEGIVTGKINHSFAMIITATGSGTSYSVTPDISTGVFKLQGMVPGTYTLNFFQYVPNYFRPDTTLQVVAGQTIDLGTLSAQGGGVFTGIVNPIGSVTRVSVKNVQAGNPAITFPSATTGAFRTAPLLPGTYQISFITSNGYKSPGDTILTLAPGQTIDLSTITALPNMVSGLPFTPMGGTLTRQTYIAPVLTIDAKAASMGGGLLNNFKLTMDNVTGVGTYQCNGTATSNMTYTTNNNTQTWSTNNPGGSGTVVVTNIDPVKKEITGTFTATLVSNTAGAANVVINNGSFHFAY